MLFYENCLLRQSLKPKEGVPRYIVNESECRQGGSFSAKIWRTQWERNLTKAIIGQMRLGSLPTTLWVIFHARRLIEGFKRSGSLESSASSRTLCSKPVRFPRSGGPEDPEKE